MNLKLTPGNVGKYFEWWHGERHRARTDLLFLCNVVLGYGDVSREVHGPILDALQWFPGADEDHKTIADLTAALAGQILWKPKCRMEWLPPNEGFVQSRDNQILFPRGHLKSTVCTVAHSIQWILNYPNVRILLTTATETLVQNFVIQIRDQFRMNEVLRSLFPELCPQAKDGRVPELGNLSGFVIPGRDNGRKELGPGGKEPTVMSSTVGSAITGYHGDVFKSDDLVEKINSSSQGGIDDVIRHFGSMGDLLEKYNSPDPDKPLKGWQDVIGTPWDFSDLYQVRRNAYEEAVAKEREPGVNMVIRSAAPNWPDGPYLWPERMGYKALKEIEDDPTKGPSQLCTPGYSPILMADLTEKPIAEIQVGDMVMGFERDESFFRGKMRLKPTKVLAVHALGTKPCQRMFMESGRTADCTPQHKWYTGRYPSEKEPHRKLYAPAKVGFEMTSVVPPLRELTEAQQRWMDWLGGLMDGEGSCVGRNTLFLSQSPDANPEVCAMIDRCLTELGYNWTMFERPASDAHGRKATRGHQYMLRGGRKVAREVYVRARMAKRERIYKSIMAKALLSEKSSGSQRVHRIEEIMPQPVYGLTTETGNYVVWGFASSNSAQYLMNPIIVGTGLVDDIKELVWKPAKELDDLLPGAMLTAALDLAGMDQGAKGSDNDRTCLTVGGWVNGRLLIPWMLYGRPPAEEVIEWIFQAFEKFPGLTKLKIEKEAHARVLLPFLRKEMSRRAEAGMKVSWLPIEEITRSNQQSKKDKIRGTRPWWKSGSIWLSDSLPYRTAIETEIKGFPKYRHDDILDTITDLMHEAKGVSAGVMVDHLPKAPELPSDNAMDRLLRRMDQEFEPQWAGREEYDRDTGFML